MFRKVLSESDIYGHIKNWWSWNFTMTTCDFLRFGNFDVTNRSTWEGFKLCCAEAVNNCLYKNVRLTTVLYLQWVHNKVHTMNTYTSSPKKHPNWTSQKALEKRPNFVTSKILSRLVFFRVAKNYDSAWRNDSSSEVRENFSKMLNSKEIELKWLKTGSILAGWRKISILQVKMHFFVKTFFIVFGK